MTSVAKSGVFSFLETHESKIWFLLRMAVCWEFIGHGAFGVITKEGWLPYFAVYGIPENVAWKLMPIVGVMDITLGILAFFTPRRGFLLFMAAWGLMTAFLRPFAGEPWSEFFERSYNYCVPMAAYLVATWDVKPHGWWNNIKNVPHLAAKHWRFLKIMLQIAIGVYLIGHGAFGAFDGKAGLAGHYDAVGISALFGSTETAMQVIGWFEILLGLAVFAAPIVPLLIFVCIWKIATEMLFPLSGAFWGVFEFIERGSSYSAPIVLCSILAILKRKGATDSYAQEEQQATI